MYKNGEITNELVVTVLKNINNDMKNMLSPIEKDAINKAIKNTLLIERVYEFLNVKGDII